MKGEKTYYETAAKWWSEKVKNASPANFNNGDKSQAGGMSMIFASLIAMENAPKKEAIEAFEKELAKVIKAQVEENGSLMLDCDYAPDAILTSVAIDTGVDPSGFPWKTTMKVTAESVEVSFGYGASWQKIYPEV